jgi:drug/metabolite transporter (DMT)-like permease
MLGAVLASLAAAVAFGASAALMHHGASGAPDDVGGTAALLRHIVKQWRWLLGMVASLTGLGLHVVALRLGSIALVQPIVVSGLVFAFIFRSGLDRRLPSRRLIGWVLLTSVGLAVLVGGASTTESSSIADGVAATVMLAAGAAVAVVAALVARRASAGGAGLLFGIGAGVIFGLIGGTLKAATEAGDRGDLFTSWPLYVVLPLGAAAFLLNQRAYHVAPLSKSLPVLNLLNPVVAIAFGMAVFHERPSAEVLPILAEVVGLVAVLSGIFFLARSDHVTAAL